MRNTINLLLTGDERIVTYYVAAHAHWKEILASEEAKTVETLARRLALEQNWFEHNCGGRSEGQEIMAFAGIGHLYDKMIGFDACRELVLRIFDAFLASFCSIEVKWHAERAAETYHLKDLREESLDE